MRAGVWLTVRMRVRVVHTCLCLCEEGGGYCVKMGMTYMAE